MRDALALPGGPSSTDSHDESFGTVERRKSPAHQGDPALSHRALVSDAALRQLTDCVQTLAWHPDDRVEPSPTSTASVDHDSDTEGGRSRRLTAGGGCPTPHAFTGRIGLDHVTVTVSEPLAVPV